MILEMYLFHSSRYDGNTFCNNLSDLKSANDKELSFNSLFLLLKVFIYEHDIRKMKISVHPMIYIEKLIVICSCSEEM